jgi:hypothetical protein
VNFDWQQILFGEEMEKNRSFVGEEKKSSN